MKKVLAVVLLLCFCIGIAACSSNNNTPVITLGSKTTESVETESEKTTTVTDKTTETTNETTIPGTTSQFETETTSKNVETKDTTIVDPTTETTTKEEITTKETTPPETTTKDPSVTTEETTREDPFEQFTDVECALTFYADAVMGKRIEEPSPYILINAYYDVDKRVFVEDEVHSLSDWLDLLNDDSKRSVAFEKAPLLKISKKVVIEYQETATSATQDPGTAIISSIAAYGYESPYPVTEYKYISNGDGIEELDFTNLVGTGLSDVYLVVKLTQFGSTYRVQGDFKTEYVDYYAIVHVQIVE